MLLWSLACAREDTPAVALDRLRKLGPVLPPIAARRVTYVRDQDWCRAIAYDRGHFAASDHPSTCALGADPVLPLDATADADRKRWFAALESTGIALLYASFAYAPCDGADCPLVSVELARDTDEWLGPSRSYVWSRDDPPASMGSEEVVVPLGDDWYAVTADLL
jgi:hypothetical protein